MIYCFEIMQVAVTSVHVKSFGVTVYRNTGLDDLRHIQFSRQFGDLEKVPKFRGPNIPDRFGYPELFDAGNTDHDGNIVQKGSRCVTTVSVH